MSGGTFNIDRGLWDDAAFPPEPFSRREAWIWMIKEASWKDRERNVAGKPLLVRRGQLAASSRFLAKAWDWSEPKVRRFLNMLENRRMIGRVTDAGITLITLCKYDHYQGVTRVSDAPVTHQPTQVRRTRDANEKKEERREDKSATHSERFGEFWSAYPHRGGVKKGKQAALKAWVKALRTGTDEAEIIAAAARYHRDAQVQRGFAPDPSTWLNQQRWQDEIEPERKALRVVGGVSLPTIGDRRTDKNGNEWVYCGSIDGWVRSYS